jgi:muramoyltetrapeptide carboxypeptidase
MMRQLLMAGKLSSLAGVVLGSFTECEGRAGAPTSTVEHVLEEYLAGLGVPVLAGLPVGHSTPNLTLPHGAMLRLDADRQRLTLLA